MDVNIERAGDVPPFRQIKEQISEAISGGELAVGTRLPAVRTLARHLGVAPGTVARAYRELEASGVVDTRGRRGTYVADPADEQSQHRRHLAGLAADYAAAASQWSIAPADAIALVEQAVGDGVDHSPG